MGVKLWMLRHARVELAPGICYGCSDVPAHAEHTESCARAAALQLPKLLPVWVYGLRRAKQMADVLHRLRPDLGEPRTDTRLNEMDFGLFELQAWDAIPRAALDAWTADFAHHLFGGAESTQMVIDRVAHALDDLRSSDVTQTLWITHAGVIRAVHFLRTHGARPIENTGQWPLEAPAPGALICLDL